MCRGRRLKSARVEKLYYNVNKSKKGQDTIALNNIFNYN